MRGVLIAIVLALATAGAAADPPPELATHLRTRGHDRAIRADVLRWHHTMRNGCVAYASTALRHVGIELAERGVLDGDGVSRLTRGFVRYLEDQLGWRRIVDAGALAPGDLVFTTDVIPEYPAHVFVFLGWRSRPRQVAVIADNTGYRKPRPLAAGRDRDGFAFALRAPR
jgi:hypothetical protein